ncbi:MAG: insulinase family protein [Planctomycetes bacterium]|nr:insulinase family protein [Planctomycetota bacterium]
MNENGFVDRTLSNGLRVVIEPMPHVQSAAAGFLVRTGARDEEPRLAGVSHFLEHMCFKGTSKRSWHQITIDFDTMGSTYNAFTSKERTFYFGWVRTEDLEKQIELLADMMRSTIPPDEYEMEKKVILEEIAMSDDQIDRQVYELVHEKAYAGHSLAWPVLGTTDSISRLTRDELHGYFQDRYHPANMILVVAGNVQPDDVMAMAERICGSWQGRAPRPPRLKPAAVKPGLFKTKSERFVQQAMILAYPAPSATDEDRETGDVVASILGGHNSRFYWNIIQAGIAPHVAAFRVDYCDHGMFMAYAFCEPPKADELLAAIRREMQRINDEGVTPDEVQRVKNRTRTGLATEAEAPYYRLMQLAGEVDVLGAPRSVAKRLADIDAVTVDRVREYFKKWPITGPGLLVSLGPRDWPN